MPEFGDVQLASCGIAVGKDATLTDLEKALEYACAVQRHAPWWIGDLVAELDRRLGDQGAQAYPLGYSCDLIERCRACATLVEYDNRNPNISWTHHFVVATRLPPAAQKAAFEKAEMEGWTHEEFRQWVANLNLLAIRNLSR